MPLFQKVMRLIVGLILLCQTGCMSPITPSTVALFQNLTESINTIATIDDKNSSKSGATVKTKKIKEYQSAVDNLRADNIRLFREITENFNNNIKGYYGAISEDDEANGWGSTTVPDRLCNQY